MDVIQIDKEIERLQALREQTLRAEEELARRQGLVEARDIIARVVDDLRRVEELGYLPPRLREALTDEKQKFNPGMYIKRPKLPEA